MTEPMPCMPNLPILPEPGESILHLAGEEDPIHRQRCSRCTRVIADTWGKKWPVGAAIRETRGHGFTGWGIEP